MQGVKAAFVQISGKAGGPGFSIASAALALAVRNPGPTITVGGPLGTKVAAANVTLNGVVYDAVGVQSVKVKLDGGSSISLTGPANGVTWEITHAFGKLAKGDHTMVINATDSLGVSAEKTVTFTVAAGPSNVLGWGIAAVGWILFVIVAVWAMMKMRGPKPETMGPTPEAPEVMKQEPEQKM